MASITKSSGTLFPLINQMKDQNQNQTIVEPKLKRTVGQRQDVRTGDGLTTIMSKVWGLLKKQDEYIKSATKEMKSQEKFRKESKDLMKKNNEVILKALNVMSKDATNLLTKILKTEDKSLKEQQNALEQQKVANELKNDFAKEDKKETQSAEDKRHQEIVELLKKMAGQEEGKGKTKKEEKSFAEKLIAFMGGKFKDLLVGALGSVLGKDFAKFLVTNLASAFSSILLPGLKGIFAGAIRLALANPLMTLASVIAATYSFLSNKEIDTLQERGGTKAAEAGKKRQTDEFLNSMDIGAESAAIMNASEGKDTNEDVIRKAIQEKSTQQFPSSVNVKAGAESAGPAEQGTEALKQNLSSKIEGFNRITAVKDEYHKENKKHSKHNEGLAVDFTVKEKTPKAYEAAAEQTRSHLRSIGLKDSGANPDFKVINEYSTGTGSHIHVQFRDKEAANKYLASNGKPGTTQMASVEAPTSETTANQTATAAPEEKEKPKFLPEIIKDFANLAQSQFKASESLFTPQNTSAAPAINTTPSGNLNKTILESTELRDKVAKSQGKNQPPVNITNINNTAMSGGAGGGSSNVPLTSRSNDSVLSRVQSGISVVI